MALKEVELANPISCINRAANDEPIFVLRANDANAAGTVREWARRYMNEKGGNETAMTSAQRAKYYEALALAEDMEAWYVAKKDPSRLTDAEWWRERTKGFNAPETSFPGLVTGPALDAIRDLYIAGEGVLQISVVHDELIVERIAPNTFKVTPPDPVPLEVKSATLDLDEGLRGTRFCGKTHGCIHYAGHTGDCSVEEMPEAQQLGLSHKAAV